MKFHLLAAVFTLFLLAHNLAIAQYQYLKASISTSVSKLHSSFSIAGDENGKNPNVLSELIWDNVVILSSTIEGTWYHGPIAIRARAQYGSIKNGQVTDTDYRYDDRTGIFYQKKLSAHRGELRQFHISPMYTFPILKTKISVGPSLEIRQQNLNLINAKNPEDSQLDYVEGIDSYYHTQWKSVGAVMAYQRDIFSKIQLYIMSNPAILWMRGKGRWNLREDFAQPVSYIHRADKGMGIEGVFRFSYYLSPDLSAFSHYNVQYMQINKGKDTLFLSDSSEQTTMLNEVISTLHCIGVGIRYRWQ